MIIHLDSPPLHYLYEVYEQCKPFIPIYGNNLLMFLPIKVYEQCKRLPGINERKEFLLASEFKNLTGNRISSIIKTPKEGDFWEANRMLLAMRYSLIWTYVLYLVTRDRMGLPSGRRIIRWRSRMGGESVGSTTSRHYAFLATSR